MPPRRPSTSSLAVMAGVRWPLSTMRLWVISTPSPYATKMPQTGCAPVTPLCSMRLPTMDSASHMPSEMPPTPCVAVAAISAVSNTLSRQPVIWLPRMASPTTGVASRVAAIASALTVAAAGLAATTPMPDRPMACKVLRSMAMS